MVVGQLSLVGGRAAAEPFHQLAPGRVGGERRDLVHRVAFQGSVQAAFGQVADLSAPRITGARADPAAASARCWR
jgi:hypothetical protein